ncbi:hypothetical protein GE21DRAFT_1201449 [Neurospora crassa]|nr:hypothetical protein B14D6.60 [imported] - Neurospora crassa [Neurospora crassa]KHE87605.1 hypothetical protein GE21DRAFT_1201449 [Neurospora crassa]
MQFTASKTCAQGAESRRALLPNQQPTSDSPFAHSAFLGNQVENRKRSIFRPCKTHYQTACLLCYILIIHSSTPSSPFLDAEISKTQKTRISTIVHTTTIRYDARAQGALPVYCLMGCLDYISICILSSPSE